ncbi:MAG: hypothetical protein MUF62_02760 [Chitinophagaceae bacterium]|jgi:hypothetical protein|nr:hypothetical protein [Chitinophagaceae bacterium]
MSQQESKRLKVTGHWNGWKNSALHVPSAELEHEQILTVLYYAEAKPLVMAAVYRDEQYYNVETGEPLDNVCYWSELPSFTTSLN